MIIDTHVHIYDGAWPPESPKGLSAPEMLEVMDQYGIGNVWISPVSGLVRDFREYNDSLYDFIKTDDSRFTGFFTVNPNFPETAVDEIKRCVEVLGCKGLKLHPWLQAFSTSYGIVAKIIEACIDYKLPVLFHDGTPPYSDSLQIAVLAELYPEAKIILGHSGLYDFYRNSIAAAKRLENIYLCLCGPAIGDVRHIISQVGTDRLIFGSDFGTKAVGVLTDRIKTIEYAVEDEALRNKIFYENANKLIHV